MAKAFERLAAVAVGALLLAACTETEVTALGPRRPALPPDCPVQVFQGRPTYDYTPVATVHVSRCEAALGEEGCLSELRMAACSYGADTVFGVTKELSSIRM